MHIANARPMPLLTIIIVLAVVGVVLWLVTTYIPMQPAVKNILVAVCIIVLIVWLLQVFGVWDHLNAVRVGR